MKYFVTDHNDEVQGPYSLEKITTLVAAGDVEATALLCEEGSETWLPLGSILPATPAAVPPAAASLAPDPISPPRPTKAPAPPRGVNVVVVLCISLGLVLIFLAAYFLGRRL